MSCRKEREDTMSVSQEEEEEKEEDVSLPTFQMFREKKRKVCEEVRYHYRVWLDVGSPALPWLSPVTSSISDWSLRGEAGGQIVLTELLVSQADTRLSIVLEGGCSTGKTSILRQICLDWGRGASYLQHFHLVIFLDGQHFPEETDLDKHIMKTYRMLKLEKLNLHKWEVQKEPFMLVLDNFSKLSAGSLEMLSKILSGQTYSHCSVIAASQPRASLVRMFDLAVRLEGWRDEVVMEVISKHFSHSPNKVLALQLKLSHSPHQPHRNLLNCPLLAQLACLAYEDTGELPGSTSESLHSMMRSVLRRELYTAGRTLHNTNYDQSLARLGEKCLHSLARGRAYLRSEEVAGLVKKYKQTLLGFLTPVQAVTRSYRRERERREQWEPLHRSMMEFSAAFYLKSLSESNQQEQLGREVSQLFENNCQSTENILASALEMLAPDNACSDILTRIPQQVAGPEVGVARLVRLAEEEVGVSVPAELSSVLDLPARLRLLHTAGFTAHHMSSLLTGLRDQDQPPVIVCQPQLILGWTNIAEVRPDLVRSLEVRWRPDCGPLSHLALDRFFRCLAASRLAQISLSLNFCPLSSQTDPAEQLRYAGHLLGLLTTSLTMLTVRVEKEVEGEGEREGEEINVFPLLDALAQQVKMSASLTRLEVEVEMSSSQLSLVCSALQSSQSLSHLAIRGVRSGQGSAGFKQLKQLLRSGKIKILEFSTTASSMEDGTEQEVEAENQYVYEDEALISEEVKLRKLSPLLSKITELAGLKGQEVSPVEISAGCLHPCLRWSSVHPLPLCSNTNTATHYIAQALASQHTNTHHLELTLTNNTEILCLADGLVTNSSLRSLKLRSQTKVRAGGEMSLCFPLMMGVSSHLGLTQLDLSGLSFSLNSETVQLSLGALASNTALSLNKLNISGWSFCCQITEKTSMMQSLRELFRTSRISQLDLSNCTIDLSCNQRQFSLYFELESEERARSLWQDIHEEKITSHTITELSLAGVKMRINKKEMFLAQELSMLDCPKMEVLNLSQRPLELTQPPAKCLHLYDILENLPPSLLSSVQRLQLDHHCLHQIIPASQTQGLRDLLSSLADLQELSLSGSWLATGGAGGRKEELLKYCLEWLPRLETLHLNYCYLSKDVGLSMSRIIKTRAKKGLRMKLDTQTGLLTVQRV